MSNVIFMKGYKIDETIASVVHEPSMVYGYSIEPTYLIRYARQGLSMNYLLKLSQKLSLSLQEISGILHVSLRTLQRYTATKLLDTDISSKLLTLTALHNHGVAVFGSEDNFNVWLKTPILTLDNHTPLSYLDTPFGFTIIDQLLGRIEHGVFA